jgi:hypothetical protein
MFSVIRYIYNKKTKGHTAMELFTGTGKPKKFFFTSRDVRWVHHGWHGTHRYNIQVLATHASTWVHRYSSPLQRTVSLGQRGHVAMVGRIHRLWHIPPKKSQGVMSGDHVRHSISGWSFPDARRIQRPGNTVFRYFRLAGIWTSVCFATCPGMSCQ